MTEKIKNLLKTAIDEKVEAVKKLAEPLRVGNIMLGNNDCSLYFYNGIDELASILGTKVKCTGTTINGKPYVRKSFYYNDVECHSLDEVKDV